MQRDNTPLASYQPCRTQPSGFQTSISGPTSQEIAVTRDAFLGGSLWLGQPANGYRAGLDAVLLAATVPAPAKHDARLLDVGAGVGTIGLCVARRLRDFQVGLIDQSGTLVELAQRNIADNQLSERVWALREDILSPRASDDQLGDNSFDVVTANPPYYEVSKHRQSPDALKSGSHAMPDNGLDTWARYMARKTRAGGMAIIIHRADRLAELISAFAPRFGAFDLLPLHPRLGEPASRVIIRGIKGSRAPLSIYPGIHLHGSGNGFTARIDRVLKSPTALDFAD